MKRLLFIALASFFISHTAHANPQLAKANNCFSCHSLDKKIIGPSLREIAKKYADQTAAETKISELIRRGSVGLWGSTPMPSMPNISDADLKILAKWILSL